MKTFLKFKSLPFFIKGVILTTIGVMSITLFSFKDSSYLPSVVSVNNKANTSITVNKTENEIVKQKEGLYEAGVFLVKKYEGLYLFPYLCSEGVPTIGWGHTFEFRKINGNVYLTDKGKKELSKYRNGISFIQAQEIFRCEYLESLKRTQKKLGNIKERSHLLALTSVAYNAGDYGMFAKGSAPGKSYKNGEEDDSIILKIRTRFLNGRKGTKGIKRRRNEEANLFGAEYDEILDNCKLWKKEVQDEIKKVLPKYGLHEKLFNRQNILPMKRRADCEMSQSKINEFLTK